MRHLDTLLRRDTATCRPEFGLDPDLNDGLLVASNGSAERRLLGHWCERAAQGED
jgi:hypothetical protein